MAGTQTNPVVLHGWQGKQHVLWSNDRPLTVNSSTETLCCCIWNNVQVKSLIPTAPYQNWSHYVRTLSIWLLPKYLIDTFGEISCPFHPLCPLSESKSSTSKGLHSVATSALKDLLSSQNNNNTNLHLILWWKCFPVYHLLPKYLLLVHMHYEISLSQDNRQSLEVGGQWQSLYRKEIERVPTDLQWESTKVILQMTSILMWHPKSWLWDSPCRLQSWDCKRFAVCTFIV